MFIGHFGIGLGAKKAAPAVSLGTLFLAAQLLDLLWPTFLLLGWEHVEIQPGITTMAPLKFTDYPLTHSLLFAVIWGVVFGFAYYLIKRETRGAIVIGVAVVSHWILDLFVHIKDLPLYPASNVLLGFGLWNNRFASIFLESLIFIVGLGLYLRVTKAKNVAGKYGFWTMIIFLIVIHIANIFGTPPPSVTAIAWAGELQWLFVLWAYWVDKNRIQVKHYKAV